MDKIDDKAFVIESKPKGFYLVSRVLNRRYGPYNTAEIARMAKVAVEDHGLEWADAMEAQR